MLLYSILMEPQVVIPDIFFFNSPVISAHIGRAHHEYSLLEEAIRQEIVIPAIREKADSFVEVEAYLRRDGIYGMLAPEESGYLAERLTNVTKRVNLGFLWPERMASSYATILVDVLQRETSPQGVDDVLWEKTAGFRTESLDRAIESDAGRPGGYGVRRASVILSVAADIGVLRDPHETPSEHEIVDRYRSMTKDVAPLVKFFDWLDELYFANQALRFGVRPTTASSGASAVSLVSEAVARHRDEPGASRSEEVLEMTVELPSSGFLAKLSPRKLLDWREFGVEWYAAASAFVRTPNAQARWRAERALEEFARKLNTEANAYDRELVQTRIVARVADSRVVGQLLEIAKFASSGVPFHSFAQVFRSGYVAMQQRKTQISEPLPVRVAPGSVSRFVSFDRGKTP
ncbi:hypothetical protein ABZ342_48145 [Amycolatopsis sp. NPDC005961]|uniref:hypothetical protein n=1 Tax=Amycolatopsis sp. NPDC005961 TaxID=3156720 RepID=UPI0033F581CA